MADAPEVTPNQPSNPTHSPSPLMRTTTTSANAPEVVPPPASTPSLAANTPLPISPSPPYLPTPDIKSFNSNASIPLSERSKAISPPPEADRITPKFPVVEDEWSDVKIPVEGQTTWQPINDRGMAQDDVGAVDAAGEATPYESPNVEKSNKKLPRTATAAPNEWHFGFWDCCGEPSLACEAFTCPCILAGRTHARVKGVSSSDISSTNCFCFSCCIGTTVLPFIYWAFTSVTRRELRHRHGIEGSNGVDCLKAGFCCCCACVQEERESRWREQQRLIGNAGDGGYGRRGEEMRYQPQPMR